MTVRAPIQAVLRIWGMGIIIGMWIWVLQQIDWSNLKEAIVIIMIVLIASVGKRCV